MAAKPQADLLNAPVAIEAAAMPSATAKVALGNL